MKTQEVLNEALDAIASKLADQGRVEEAWYLRGVWDGLNGDDPQRGLCPSYRRVYQRGYDDVQRAIP